MNAENLAAERQKALELALRNEKLFLKEIYQYRTEIAKYKLKYSKEKNDYISDRQAQNENINRFLVGLKVNERKS